MHFRSKTFWGFFATYTLLISALLIFSQARTWRQSIREAQANTETANAQAVAELTDHLNAQVQEVSQLALVLHQMTWVHKLYPETTIFDDEYSLRRRSEITREFDLLTDLNPLVEQVVLIYPYRDICITSYAWTDTQFYLNKMGVGVQDQPNVMAAIRATDELVHLTAVEEAFPGESIIVVAPVEKIAQPRAYVCFFFNTAKFTESIRRQMPANMTGFSLLGADEQSEVLRLTGESDRASHSAVTNRSPFLDWTYAFSFDTSLIGLNTPDALYVRIMEFGWQFLACILISYILSLLTYRPIGRLLHKVVLSGHESDSAKGDYQTIGSCLDRLMSDNDQLRAYTVEYEKTQRANIVRRLIQGFFNLEQAGEQLKRYKLPYDDQDYYQAYLIVGCGTAPEAASRLMKLEKLVSDVTNDRYLVSDTLDSEIVLIAAFPDSSAAERGNEAILAGIRTNSEDWTGSAVFQGKIQRGFIGISLSYQYARDRYMSLYRADEPAVYFPLEWEAQLITALRVGNLPTVLHILKEIRQENERRLCAGETTADALNQLIARLVDTICRAAEGIERTDLSIGQTLDQLYASGSTDENWTLIEAFCRQICERISSSVRDNSAQSFGELLAFIKAHLHDPDLSLKLVETHLHISVQTINRLFKQNMDCTFYVFVLKERMEMAKELLIASDEPTCAIAEKVGYLNEFSFRRAFTRYTGVRPREYSLNNR